MRNIEHYKQKRFDDSIGVLRTICRMALIPLLISQSAGAQQKALESPDKPENIIIFIADGLGFAQLSLAMQRHSEKGLWQRFSATGWHQPNPWDNYLTDSAGSATALATGISTSNGSIGVDENGNRLNNIFELATERGYRTGVVTDSYVWDATPAGFTVHAKSRDDASVILDALSESQLDVLIGELKSPGKGSIPDRPSTEALFKKRFSQLDEKAGNAGNYAGKPIVGLFKESQIADQQSTPSLEHLTSVALNALASYEEPFLLLLETEELDSSGHWRNEKRLLRGLDAMQDAVTVVFDFLERHPDTLFVFTSDHETGGLILKSDWTDRRVKPVFQSFGHTGSVVPVMAVGPADTEFTGFHTNDGLGRLLKSLIN